MPNFNWTSKREQAVLALANGEMIGDVAEKVGVNQKTLYRWRQDPEFDAELDRLTLMTDIASRAERLRIAKRLVRQRIGDDGYVISKADLLDWLKFAQSETDGVKLDLARLMDELTGVSE